MIDVIIPVYNDRENLTLSLSSVAMQTIKEKIIVYIVDDCSTEIYDDILMQFQKELQINYLRLNKNSGAGIAREYGIINSKSEFICFLDSDDLFSNPQSLEKMYKFTEQGYEFISSLEYAEKFKIICNNDKDLHAKIYSRKFIKNNNIHFNNTRLHEDCYFNSIFNICNPKSMHIDEVTYYYTYNRKSITSVNWKSEFNNLEIFFYNIKQIIDFAEKNNCDTDIIKKVLYPKQEYIERVYNTAKENEKLFLSKWTKQYNLNDIFYFGDGAKK